jgi:hypothetical protein
MIFIVTNYSLTIQDYPFHYIFLTRMFRKAELTLQEYKHFVR